MYGVRALQSGNLFRAMRSCMTQLLMGSIIKIKSSLLKLSLACQLVFRGPLLITKRVQWNLGPVMNIHLNKLIDNPFENKKHLFFAGLRTGILFNQKK